MKLTEVGSRLPNELLESAAMRGVSALTPPQELAIVNGLLEGRNLVVASPTASGKTFIAEMAIIKSVIHKRKKAVYVAPMRALVSEKYEDFKKDYPFLKVAMSIGDLDSLDKWLSDYDIVFASTEKLDSLIRHGLDWLDSIGCVVFDEIHMLDDASRGPTLEILITKMRRVCSGAQIIALSATVGNAREIADWLGAGLVESEYRPVKLERGIVLNGKTYYLDSDPNGEELFGSSEIPEIRVVQDTLHRKKQALIFLSTKRNAEASSERVAAAVEKLLTGEEKAALAELSNKVLHALGKPTVQCERLAKVVEKGAAFHHGGLVNEQRRLIEQGFKDNVLKAMCSTTTLCLPAGEEIMCNFEPKPIQELTSNVNVLTHKGVFKKVIMPISRDYTGELIKIKVLGQLPMRMTPEHRVLVSRRKKHSIHGKINRQWYTYSEPEWVEAKQLTKGELTLFPRIKENQNTKKIKLKSPGPLANQCGTVGEHWSRLSKDSIELDEKGLEALGLFIAEGFTGKNGIVRFAISTKEQLLTEKIEEWLKSLGLRTTVKDFERHRRTVNACSKQLAETLKELFGTHAENKRVPQDFIKLPEKKLIPLVRGMWLGDGSVYVKKNYGCAEYVTVSKVLAKQLFIILVKMGYMPSIKCAKPSVTPTRKKYSVNITNHRTSYRISVSGKQLTRFAREVLFRELAFQGNRTYNIGLIDENYYYMPVQSITAEDYSGKVYNLEVEDDASYVCSFIVHNSMGVNLPAHTVLVRDTSRYSDASGSEKMSVNEVTQLFGRAGRPKYDTEGRALLIAKSKGEIMDLYARYIAGELEPISSKLGVLPVLRTHLLAFVATRMLRTKESMLAFLGETLYGRQFGDTREMDRLVTEILKELEVVEVRAEAGQRLRADEDRQQGQRALPGPDVGQVDHRHAPEGHRRRVVPVHDLQRRRDAPVRQGHGGGQRAVLQLREPHRERRRAPRVGRLRLLRPAQAAQHRPHAQGLDERGAGA